MRKVRCKDPECPHERILRFNDWCRTNLPSSQDGLMVFDIDVLIYSKITGKVIVIELKTNNSEPSIGQRLFLTNVNNWFSTGMNAPKWKFQGVHLIQFEKYFFNDGKVFFDRKEVREEELKNYLININK